MLKIINIMCHNILIILIGIRAILSNELIYVIYVYEMYVDNNLIINMNQCTGYFLFIFLNIFYTIIYYHVVDIFSDYITLTITNSRQYFWMKSTKQTFVIN